MALLKERHIRSESGIVDAFYHERLKAKDGFSRTVPSDALKPINSVVDGFEKLPEAISELYQGSRAGELRVGSHRNKKRRITMTMKAWRLDRLGGDLRFENVPMPEVRPGSILVRVEASTLMSYMKPYVEGRLPPYHAPVGGFTPGGKCVHRGDWQGCLAVGAREARATLVLVPLIRERPRLCANSYWCDLFRSRQREGAGGLAGRNACGIRPAPGFGGRSGRWLRGNRRNPARGRQPLCRSLRRSGPW
jgi:hypothetical protein